MKTIIRLPTDQFAYIEQEIEATPSQAVAAYHELVKAWKGDQFTLGDGLNAKQVDIILDGWFLGQGISSDLYDQRNSEQDKWFQAIKRSLKRIKAKGEDPENVLSDLGR